jgi:hypothetical protein
MPKKTRNQKPTKTITNETTNETSSDTASSDEELTENNSKTQETNPKNTDVDNVDNVDIKEKDINYYQTLEGMTERYNRFENNKIKRLLKEKSKKPEIIYGIELLYNILEQENIKVLKKLQRDFKDHIEPHTDLTTLLKPPYLVPEIVNHESEKTLNDY